MKITDPRFLLVLLLCLPFAGYTQQHKVPRITKTDSVHFIKAAAQGTPVKAPLLNKYRMVSHSQKHTVLPSEQLVCAIGMTYLAAGKKGLAFELFEMNKTNYPASFKVYDTLGDYYTATGDNPMAIEEYKKAIRLNYNIETVEKLKNLQGDREHL